MAYNHFFAKQGPFPLKKIVKEINCSNNPSNVGNIKINGIKNLVDAQKNDLTFLNSNRYKEISFKTKAVACITSSSFSGLLPTGCIALDVKNVSCGYSSFKTVLPQRRFRLSRFQFKRV